MRPDHRALTIWAALAISLAGCGGTPSQMRPAWLDDLISELEAAPVANPPAKIVRRVYEAGGYYYLPPRCCDIWSDLYSADGTLVCHPDGGISGAGDGSCPELGGLRRSEIVWQDPRR